MDKCRLSWESYAEMVDRLANDIIDRRVKKYTAIVGVSLSLIHI